MGIFDNYECEGQMSIFDFLQEEKISQHIKKEQPKKTKYTSAVVGSCENKDNCPEYPYQCKGKCFWCHRNKNLQIDNCLNCSKYKIECFPEHPTAHGKCQKYEVLSDWHYTRRCQTCIFWSCNLNQSLAVWGVKGYCRKLQRETASCSHCQDYECEE